MTPTKDETLQKVGSILTDAYEKVRILNRYWAATLDDRHCSQGKSPMWPQRGVYEQLGLTAAASSSSTLSNEETMMA